MVIFSLLKAPKLSQRFRPWIAWKIWRIRFFENCGQIWQKFDKNAIFFTKIRFTQDYTLHYNLSLNDVRHEIWWLYSEKYSKKFTGRGVLNVWFFWIFVEFCFFFLIFKIAKKEKKSKLQSFASYEFFEIVLCIHSPNFMSPASF